MSLKLALAQMDIAWHDRKTNHASARRLAAKARDCGAQVIVLPEMFSTGFSMETDVTAEPLSGSTPSFLRDLASDLGIWVIGGFVMEREGEKPRNVALTVDPTGADATLYEKIHLISILDEDRHYGPGRLPAPFHMEGLDAACFICYDLRFPELFRAAADACGLVLVIASWPDVRRAHWDTLLRARAVENQCYVAGVNRVGEGGGHRFAGGSLILDPLGTPLAEGGDREELLLADIDPGRVQDVRERFPFLRDRNSLLFEKAGAFEDA
jgi:predicted amidohydrolase